MLWVIAHIIKTSFRIFASHGKTPIFLLLSSSWEQLEVIDQRRFGVLKRPSLSNNYIVLKILETFYFFFRCYFSGVGSNRSNEQRLHVTEQKIYCDLLLPVLHISCEQKPILRFPLRHQQRTGTHADLLLCWCAQWSSVKAPTVIHATLGNTLFVEPPLLSRKWKGNGQVRKSGFRKKKKKSKKVQYSSQYCASLMAGHHAQTLSFWKKNWEIRRRKN